MKAEVIKTKTEILNLKSEVVKMKKELMTEVKKEKKNVTSNGEAKLKLKRIGKIGIQDGC